MANRFLSNIKINDAYTFPASDGSNGQVIVTDGSGNLSFANPATSSSASVIYRDNFTGDGSTTVFYLQNSLSDEDQTQIYIDGVYQEKGTYSLSNNAITFTTAPPNGDSVEVISISGINVGPTTIYQDNFTGDGTTTDFTLAQAVSDEVKTMVYFNGVYQFKGTYSLNGTLMSFDTAPTNGVAIEVISIASAAAADYNQKMLFYGKASEAISKGDAIMLGGQQGDHFLLAKATQAAIAANHEYFLGLASQDLAQGEFGYVTEFGKIIEIDTSAYTAGDILWFDAGGSTAGALTTTEPAAPLAKIQVAAVIRSHQNEGVLFIRPTWYHELGELHDVNITSVSDKDLLVWNDTAGYWENSKTVDTLTGNTLSATTLTGTLSTAAQTNITSVGTLSSLAVSGNLTVDTNTLYVDAANNRVGIGTSTPDLHLDVNGYALASSGFVGGSSGLSLWSDANALSAGLILNTSGNVGIGTSSPATKLDVNGAGTFLGNIALITDATSGNYSLIQHKYDGAAKAYSGYNSGFAIYGGEADVATRIQSGGQYAITALTNGNVGIGVTSPDSKITIANANGSFYRFGYAGTSDVYIDTDNMYFRTANGASNTVTINSSGSVGINTTSPETLLEVQQDSVGNNGVTFDANASNRATLQFQVNTNYTQIQTYGRGSSSGHLSLNPLGNNVGIGTSSPDKKLHVDGGDLRVRDAGNVSIQIVSSTSDNSAIQFGDDSDVNDGRIVYENTGNNMLFYTSDSEKMRITSGGNIGIGTTSPEDKLHVANGGFRVSTIANSNHLSIKNIQTSTSSTAYEKKIRFLGYNNVEEASIVGLGNQYWGSAYNGLSFRTGTTEKMRIDSSGRVGIGTSPDQLLHIRATNAPTLKIESGDTSGASGEVIGKVDFWGNDFSGTGRDSRGYIASVYEDAFARAALVFASGAYNQTASERMRITSDGRLLYNTTSILTYGDAMMQVAANGSNWGGTFEYQGTTSGRGAASFVLSGGSTVPSLVRFQYGGSSVGSITTNGSSTAYNTTSDYRLKENVVEMIGALDRVDALKPSRFNFISDANKTVDGFLAHEVAEVVPEAISGEKDAVDEEGNPIYQGIDQSKLVPLLVGAIQEQQEIIEDLKQRILTLENNNNG